MIVRNSDTVWLPSEMDTVRVWAFVALRSSAEQDSGIWSWALGRWCLSVLEQWDVFRWILDSVRAGRVRFEQLDRDNGICLTQDDMYAENRDIWRRMFQLEARINIASYRELKDGQTMGNGRRKNRDPLLTTSLHQYRSHSPAPAENPFLCDLS